MYKRQSEAPIEKIRGRYRIHLLLKGHSLPELLEAAAVSYTHLADIASRSGEVLEAYRAKLRARIAELTDGVEINEERLAQEVAYFAEKSCIDEELVRLSSHFAQFEQIINGAGDVGRKLDFLVQEMNRETNTIGSKANDLTIAQLVVEMKSRCV